LLGNTFTLPQPPVDPWNQIDAQWWQQPAGASSAPPMPQPNDAWDRTTPAWLRSAMPPLSNRGILGSFLQPNDAAEQDNSAPPQSDMPPATGRGILAALDQWIIQIVPATDAELSHLSSNSMTGKVKPLLLGCSRQIVA
jgi:hypothetical protein